MVEFADFQQFFRIAFSKADPSGPEPYPYQRRLAESREFPDTLQVPTGAGKTAAVLLSWLWRRRFHSSRAIRERTPRRLVYCLPMRALVEQTSQRARLFLNNLELADDEGVETPVGLYILMGGRIEEGWALRPEDDAILVGTQDMLLSRALNRGYGASRFRWPIEFGLLNTDCQWVFDETQLMGVGRASSTQLEAFRHTLGSYGLSRSLWMSATLHREDLSTVDFEPHIENLRSERLTAEDTERPALATRLRASKVLRSADLQAATAKTRQRKYRRDLADLVLDRHREGTQTLVVMNRVNRAVRLYERLRSQGVEPDVDRPPGDQDSSAVTGLLAHSRFRGAERRRLNERLQEPVAEDGPGRIVVATQVVEAGVDLSSRVLFTELAPWPSLVQRFGRCNRYGEHPEADVYWIDLEDGAEPPYEVGPIDTAREQLEDFADESVAPADLEVQPLPITFPVLRKRDLFEFFDTEPDLSGNDVDVSPYIREHEERDVRVFWRDWDSDDSPSSDLPGPSYEELCSVPIGALREVLDSATNGWSWDHLDGQWRRLRRDELRPGQIVLLRSSAGHYSTELGWNPDAGEPVPVVPTDRSARHPPAMDDDRGAEGASWETLADHSAAVVAEVDQILEALGALEIPESTQDRLRTAARYHDLGKAHPVFQQAVAGNGEDPPAAETLWAKSPAWEPYERPHFRHELASAVAILSGSEVFEESLQEEGFLIPYLVAAHHGKVRLAIRALPGERTPSEGADLRFARGVWDRDTLPEVNLGDGHTFPGTVLDLTPMELGRAASGKPSWLERSLRLVEDDDLGPFRLGFLEALLRIADWRVSAGREDAG